MKIAQADRDEIINILEAKGIAPQDGVTLLAGVIYSILKVNGYTPIEICRNFNELIMSIKEEPESLQ